MILRRLSVLNYKNIREVTLELSPKMNCLIGSNGVGKTNFLDAVYYLSFCRSAFNNMDSQNITHGEDFFVLQGSYETDQGELEDIYCGMKRGTKKHFKRNKKEYKRLSQHIGLIPIVFVSPSDAILIEGGSEERRIPAGRTAGAAAARTPGRIPAALPAAGGSPRCYARTADRLPELRHDQRRRDDHLPELRRIASQEIPRQE